MTAERERLERLLGGEALRALRMRLRRRYARSPRSEVLTLARLLPHERRALEGLLGRRARDAGSFRVAIAELDDAVCRAALAPTFRAALELLEGPIDDLGALREAEERAWASVFASVRDVRLVAYLQGAAARGLVRRLSEAQPRAAAALLTAADQVLSSLPAQGIPRSQLAATVLGDAHALDRGQPVATLVLAALRTDGEARARDVWARVGVLVNELAAPALVLNLPAYEDTFAGRLCQIARERGEPLQLSLRALLREPPRFQLQGRVVFVCENSNVVSRVADRLGAACAPLVCTDGMPSASQRVLLQQLASQGAKLLYHGDFDWPGLSIANFVLRSHGAQPWRMAASDYRAQHGKRLSDAHVTASWDPELSQRMAAAGFVLEEEAVVDELLEDLARG